MKTLAVLISNTGTGTNLQAIITAVEKKTVHARIAVVVSDSDDALGLLHARTHHIPIAMCPKKELLLPLLKVTYPVDFVVLCGWKQFISDAFIDAFPNQVLNLHPGLIPEKEDGVVLNPDGTKGLWNKGKLTNAAIDAFLASNATYAGSSIHFLTHTFDFGPVLGLCFEKIQPNDTIDTLYARLKKKENELYVSVLKKVCE